MLNHSETARKIRAMHKEGLQLPNQISVAEVPASLRSRNNTICFLMPLAHVIRDADKSRAMVGFLTTDNFAPGKIPEPDTWFKPVDFGDDDARQQQADALEAQDIASIFIRFESGHSNNISIEHTPFRPDVYPLRYLVHGTNEKNLPSIRRLGLLPGGTRGGRNHVHFALDCLLIDALRPESDCILIARPGAVADLNPVITESRYVLTPHTVPFERFCGVWSLTDRAWIDIPPDGELSKMSDYNSDIDIAMHICHHQFSWEKKNENDQNNVTWQRTDYMHYVTDQVSDTVIAANFLNSFRQAKAAPAQSATLPLQMIDLVALRKHRMTNASISFVKRFVKGSKSTCRRKRRMTSHLRRRASSRRKSRFRLRRCQRLRLRLSDRRRLPQERSAHPRRKMKGVAQSGAQQPEERHLPKQKNFSRMQMLPRNFSLSLNRKLKQLNGINVLLDLNAVKTLKRVMPKKQCFGVTPVALHIALIAASKAWHVTITSSTILRKFPQILCQTALVQKILLLMLEPLLILSY